MAAAVAAAAELAKNGGMSLFHGGGTQPSEKMLSSSRTSSMERNDVVSTENNLNEKASNDTNITVLLNPISPLDRSEDSNMEEEDAEKRLARSRERNREHARRTRLRKKAQLEALQSKVKGLENESRLLKQSLEECSIASILVGLSSGSQQQTVTDALLDVSTSKGPKVALFVGGKRKRFISEESVEKPPQPLKLNIDGRITLIGGGKTHINWKSGVYCDENGVQKQLTQDQLETLRRERNRMHAKMTRDRKKCFIAAVEKTIEQLETDNQRMREALKKVAQHHFGSNAITPAASPVSSSTPSPDNTVDPIQQQMGPSAVPSSGTSVVEETSLGETSLHEPLPRRVPHGFSLSVP
eukprot:CAMPEP_0116570242 /NCGR_PEP_ID=MMETSP0397-20121206/16820_1 /TAXON_ID=216820 /ORGANISM="Cyclophora tenuis, Strain ECT3854" /LENGTH=354 /DNA_ID=CAMNT_0004098055 /DNA_START=317 /DNA_END=1381 /DNA_ORIENTATION=+